MLRTTNMSLRIWIQFLILILLLVRIQIPIKWECTATPRQSPDPSAVEGYGCGVCKAISLHTPLTPDGMTIERTAITIASVPSRNLITSKATPKTKTLDNSHSLRGLSVTTCDLYHEITGGGGARGIPTPPPPPLNRCFTFPGSTTAPSWH